MNDGLLNRFSKEFCQLILSNYPDFEEYITIKNNDFSDNIKLYKESLENFVEAQDEEVRKALQDMLSNTKDHIDLGGYFELTIFNGEDSLNITTVDHEITIGFGGYHCHFKDMSKAINFLNQLFNEEILVYSEFNRDFCVYSGYLCVDEHNQWKQLIPKNEKTDNLKLKSWNGTYDGMIEIKPKG